MICKENQEQIVLFLYEELTDAEQIELETHLQECTACNDSFEQQKSLHNALAEDAGPWNVPSDLLVESRRALANELDRIERKRAWWRLPAFSLVFTPMRLLEWSTLVAVGLAAGVYINSGAISTAGRSIAPGSTPQTTAQTSGQTSGISTGAEPETVSNLRVVDSDSITGKVELIGDVVRPLHFSGNVQDAMAQQLLVGALQDGRNASSRMNAVEVLSRKPDSRHVKEALIHSLIVDDNAGIRLKVLQSLEPFVDQDQEVRAAFMDVLANDEVAGIRKQAIDALRRFAHDDLVAKGVHEATKNDDNAYIKIQAVQFVGAGK